VDKYLRGTESYSSRKTTSQQTSKLDPYRQAGALRVLCDPYSYGYHQRIRHYTTQRVHCKTWKPLFHFLLDTSITNSYKLSSYYNTSDGLGHKKFRKDLRDELFTRVTRHDHSSPRKRSLSPRKTISDIIWQPVEEHKLVHLGGKLQNCSACVEGGRKSDIEHIGRRKPLADLSINTTRKPRDSQEWERPKRAPRTLYGCSVCKIPLCVKPGCWESHMERLRRRD
jgi:hypothetical protein